MRKALALLWLASMVSCGTDERSGIGDKLSAAALADSYACIDRSCPTGDFEPTAAVCAHDLCLAGGKLSASCDPCAASVCSRDPYCCKTRWNAQCVSEVASICGRSCATCAPACDGKQCGPDGCGGSCGSCAAGESCDAGSQCRSGCTADCSGKQCGPDGCGGSCGACSGGQTCSAAGQCAAAASLLKFAVFGDSRPSGNNGTSGYPSAVIGGIFTLAQSSGAQFAIGTGDYMFATTQTAVDAQVQLFLQARANYLGPLYLTMGNHECTGATASNCPNFNETPNMLAFMALLPAGVTRPYYRFDLPTPLGAAKFVFIAANAWDSNQATWLQQQLADPTTYTFVMRHEPPTNTQAPGAQPSEAIVKQYPLTIELTGHTHLYKRIDTNHVISGNAGAPLQPGVGASYGLLMLEQLADGSISVTEIEEASGNAIDSWSVTAAGQTP